LFAAVWEVERSQSVSARELQGEKVMRVPYKLRDSLCLALWAAIVACALTLFSPLGFAQQGQGPALTGPQRAAQGKADQAEKAASAAYIKQCTDAHAFLPRPPGFTVTTTPSLSQTGQVSLNWQAVPGADGYQISRVWQEATYDGQPVPPLGGYNPNLVATVEGGSLGGDQRVIQPGVTSLTDRDLPLFFPVTYAIVTLKYLGVNPRARTTCVSNGGNEYAKPVTPVADPRAPVWGFADTHTHQFANLAFGGYIIGEPFDPRGPQNAFAGDYVGHGLFVGMPPHPTAGYPNFDGWPTWNTQLHQQMYVDWLYRAFLGGMKLMVMHAVGNEALCMGLTNAQPEEITLLTEAGGGASAGAVVGAGVGSLGGPLGTLAGGAAKVSAIANAAQNSGPGCNDMLLARKQWDGAKALEAFLNSQCVGALAIPPRCPQQGMGWYHIVRSAEEARLAINRGQLAVVLGIEVDRLFDCRRGPGGDPRTGGKTCGEADVTAGLDNLVSQGVRHIFPAHLADTAFAGMGLYEAAVNWNINNYFLNGVWLTVAPQCPSEIFSAYPTPPNIQINFNLTETPTALVDLGEVLQGDLGEVLQTQGQVRSYPYTFGNGTGHCNANGLTGLGKFLISQMMARHLIIDIDHMSLNSVNDTFNLTWNQRKPAAPYPVIAGHTGFLGAAGPCQQAGALGCQNRHENAKTDNELLYIEMSGGLAAAGLAAGQAAGVADYRTSWGAHIPNNCSSSSKTWVQEYLYAVDHLGGPARAAVAVATDQPLNPFVGPRFGPGGCSGGSDAERNGQTDKVAYPLTVLSPGGVAVQLPQAGMGNRVWDFNADGMAHIGLYPDLIQDVMNLGLTKNDLQPLFRSAEQYIVMWEIVEHGAPSSQTQAPQPNLGPVAKVRNLAQPAQAGRFSAGTPMQMPMMSATVCLTIDGKNCLPQNALAPMGQPRHAIVVVSSGGQPIGGAAVSVSGQNGGALTNASGIVIVNYNGCVTSTRSPIGMPVAMPAPCQGAAAKSGYQTVAISLP
jgi:hypothetical protein